MHYCSHFLFFKRNLTSAYQADRVLLCGYLIEQWWGRGPAFVQHTLRQVFDEVLQEGVANMIQEVLILRAVLLVTVDEAFYEPGINRQPVEKKLHMKKKNTTKKKQHQQSGAPAD